MDAAAAPDASLVYAWIRDIHPLLGRRVRVRTDSTLADLHWVFQIAFGWTDCHLHRFRIRKTDYVIPRHSLMEGHDARQVRLADLAFRPNERFLSADDFGDLWQLEVRIEQRVRIAPRRTVPVCIGGRWGGPPEDCGGPAAFLEQRDAAPWRVQELLGAVADAVTAKDIEALDGLSSAIILNDALFSATRPWSNGCFTTENLGCAGQDCSCPQPYPWVSPFSPVSRRDS
jgi:hypothetical protein